MSSRHVPIAAHRETLLWALENRSALVVVGETGCGKSTQLPKYLIEAGWAAPPRVVVVDEAHERSLATDLLLGLLKKASRARAALGDALRASRSATRAQNEKTRAFRDDLVSLDGDHATYGACLRRFLELRDARADPLPFCAARLDLSALPARARARPKLEKWLAAFAKSDGTALASCGDDPDPPRRALVAGFFARPPRPDATTYRRSRGPRGRPPPPVDPRRVRHAAGPWRFCDFALDDDGATVARAGESSRRPQVKLPISATRRAAVAGPPRGRK
ncbi:ATP-dependent RNA helicase [Aureococcus anophagefferens]|uniref:ATP-dependent RNA helicase n=1 Tax=Aureococcus anophagefferens TaxID=44056 RepID=A0ABR1FH30_AURAN